MTELQLAWQPTLVRLGSPPFHSFCTLQQDEEKMNQNFQFPLHYNINNYISRHVGDERKWCRSFQRITVHPGAHSQGGGKLMQIDFYENQQCVPRRWQLICSLFQNTFISPPLLTGRRHGGDGWIPYWGWVKRFLCTFSLLGSINNQDLIQLKVMTRSCWI